MTLPGGRGRPGGRRALGVGPPGECVVAVAVDGAVPPIGVGNVGPDDRILEDHDL